MTLRSLQV